MSRSTLEWYELLAKGLVWAAGIVFVLSLIGTLMIAGSDNTLPLLEDAERQGRGIAALASLGGGLTAAGVLGGLGALLRLQVSDHLSSLPPEPEGDREAEPRSKPAPKPKSADPKAGKRTARTRRPPAETREKRNRDDG
jgi:hypothetical protein